MPETTSLKYWRYGSSDPVNDVFILQSQLFMSCPNLRVLQLRYSLLDTYKAAFQCLPGTVKKLWNMHVISTQRSTALA